MIIKKKHNSQKPLICLWYVISKFNCYKFEDFVNFGIKMNADEIKFRLVNEGDVKEKLSPNNHQLGEICKEMSRIKKIYSPYINIHCMFPIDKFDQKFNNTENIKEFRNCILPFYEIVIFADGRTGPCCNFIDVFDKNIVDDINNKNVKEVWNGKIFNKFRKGNIDNIFKCKGCTIDMIFLNEKYKKN